MVKRFLAVIALTAAITATLSATPATSASTPDEGTMASAAAPTFPAGRLLLRARTAETINDYWQAPVQGAARTVLRLDDENFVYPVAVSNDGTAIAYVSTFDAESTTIRVVRANGEDTFAAEVPGEASDVAFSGDGSQLAALTVQYTEPSQTDSIYIFSADGSETPRKLIDDANDTYLISHVAWNPVAAEVAFVRAGAIGVMPTAGGTVRDFQGQCTWIDQEPETCSENGTSAEGSLDFSSNGQQLVSQLALETGSRFGIVNRNSSARTLLMHVPVYDEGGYLLGNAHFSPDDSQVVMEISPSEFEDDLYVQAAGGGTATRVGDGSIVDWQRCDDAVCPEFGTATQEPSMVSLNYATKARSIRLNGQVEPGAPTEKVTIRLQRQRGKKWVNLSAKIVTLSAASRFVTTMTLPKPGFSLCRVSVKYSGSDSLKPSSNLKMFSC